MLLTNQQLRAAAAAAAAALKRVLTGGDREKQTETERVCVCSVRIAVCAWKDPANEPWRSHVPYHVTEVAAPVYLSPNRDYCKHRWTSIT